MRSLRVLALCEVAPGINKIFVFYPCSPYTEFFLPVHAGFFLLFTENNSMELSLLDIPDEEVRQWWSERTGIPLPSLPDDTISPPSIMQLELTRNCNNACIMCHKGQKPPGQDFDRRDISDESLSLIEGIFPHLKLAMLFGDGEPMLYKNFWKIIEDIRAASPGCVIDFINNGSLINRVGIDNCFKYGVSHMGLSLGGAIPETHNYIRKLSNFERVVENFRDLKSAKTSANKKEPYVTVLIVVMKNNYHEIPQLIHLADELDFFEVECQKLHVTHPSMILEKVLDDQVEPFFQEASENAKRLRVGFRHYPLTSRMYYNVPRHSSRMNMMDRFSRYSPDPIGNSGYCLHGQPWSTVYILCDGRVFPDCHWWKSEISPELNVCGVLGRDGDIISIWNGENYRKIRDHIRKGNILPQCRGCGSSGGIKQEYMSSSTAHTNPFEE